MKITALKEKAGAYEIRQSDETIYGGIYINGKNRGVGFVENHETNRYIFEFEDGMFSKSVKIFANSKDNPLGKVSLGFTDTGTLECSDKKFEWQTLGSSKIWLDAEKNIAMLIDLENTAEKSSNILFTTNIEAKLKELLTLCGWYLLVVEYRTGLTNPNLAGMPVKTVDFTDENKSTHFNKNEVNWFDVIIDVATDF